MEEVNVPVPDPSVVLLLEVVGEVDVLQQIPRALIVEPPSLEILPPPVAVAEAMALIASVVRVGGAFSVTVTAARDVLGQEPVFDEPA